MIQYEPYIIYKKLLEKEISKMNEYQKYIDKPLPAEAVDSFQFIGGKRLFILGSFILLVDDKKMIVVSAYEKDKLSQFKSGG